MLGTFPIREIAVDMPKWLVSLDREHWLRKAVMEPLVSSAKEISRISEIKNIVPKISECEYVKDASVRNINLGTGKAEITIIINPELFYKILSEETGLDINGESGLMPCMKELAEIRRKYDRIRGALDQVEAVGYGIVMPTIDELTLEEPEIVRQGGKYGVKLRASAPSIHIKRIKQKFLIYAFPRLIKYIPTSFEICIKTLSAENPSERVFIILFYDFIFS